MKLAISTLASTCTIAIGVSLWAGAPGCGSAAAPVETTHRAATAQQPPARAGRGLASRGGSGHELIPVLPPEAGDPDAPLIVNVPIEDSSGHAFDAFYAALEGIEPAHTQARVVIYGASHVASDLYTDVLRAKLQARFGEAGIGFVQPLRVAAGYRSAGVTFEEASGWSAVNVKARAPVSDRYGLAGVYLTAEPRRPGHKGGARSTFLTRPRGAQSGNADTIELWFLKQPHGGQLRVTIDGEEHRVNTQAPQTKPGYARFKVEDAQHRVELATPGDGPVQLFGLVLERARPGVVVDSLGIPGSRARYQLLWDDAIYREHLARRKPDLVVVAYGTNESGDDDEPIGRYADDLHRVLDRIQDAAPDASCLLVGPSDRPVENPDGSFVDRPRTAQIVAVQRELSAEFGCGFFDLVAFMGGRLAMLRWVNALPALGTPDYVHFTRVGYEALGNALYAALMAGFEPLATPPNLPPTAASGVTVGWLGIR